MRDVNAALGPINNLGAVIEATPMSAPGARPVTHPYTKLFALQQLPDQIAYDVDCRIWYKMKLVEEIPKPGKGIGNFYGSIVNLKTGKGAPTTLFQVWSKEGKSWKLVSWHFDNPFKTVKTPAAPAVTPIAQVKAPKAEANADADLANQTREFLTEWLVKHDVDKALKQVAPDAAQCAAEGVELVSSKEGDPRKRLHEFFHFIAKEAGKSKTLDEMLIAPDVSHQQIELLNHPLSNVYALARISDDLAAMFHCGDRLAGKKYGKGHAEGDPRFTRGYYKTVFQLKQGREHPAAFALLWEKQGNDWKVIAFDILAH